MREKKFTRIMAFLLCLIMLLGNTVMLTSASGTDGSGETGSGGSYEELSALLNAISYEEYSKKNEGILSAGVTIEVPVADFTVVSGYGDGWNDLTDEQKADFGKRYSDWAKLTEDEKEKLYLSECFHLLEKGGLYTPANGEVSWTVDVEKPGKYAIKIEYYPDPNRSTSIERIFKINDEVPFSEARFLTIPKRWVNDYEDAILVPGKGVTKGFTAESLAAAAKEAGYTDVQVIDPKTVEKYNRFDSPIVVIGFPEFVTQSISEFADKYGVRFFQRDITNNELRPTTKDEADWMTYYLKDSSGFYANNFEFVFSGGVNKISLQSQNEPMTIKSITLYPLEQIPEYDVYKEKFTAEPGQDTIKIEAELPTLLSNKTIYPVEDRSCAINSPTDTSCSLLNTIGGDKWATAGQWVEYKFQVQTSGMYDIVARFRQDVLDGMSVCRAMYLYSDGLPTTAQGYYNGTPFVEAQALTYDYSADWQVTRLSSGKTDSNGDGKIDKKDEQTAYAVYLEKGVTYTIRLEVTLGKMGNVVREVQDILNSVNNDYLNIIQLTGITPDSYRDYGFSQVMPDTVTDMVIQANRLKALSEQLTLIAGEKSSNAATLDKVERLLREMGTDDDEVAKNLANLKSYIGTLGTFLSDAQTQPLQLDYIQIQPASTDPKDLPAAKPNIFQTIWHEIKGFFTSFFRDYNSMGALEETSDSAVEVWLATARDQSQVIRNLINNDFTPTTGVAVDLKLVAGGTLLPSILADAGPDVYLGLPQGDVINYAIRSALINIEDMGGYTVEDKKGNKVYIESFDNYIEDNFNEAAMLVLGMEDADEQMHYYGLPESQSFPMMFVRIDILAELKLDVPTTWDELMATIPTLQANNMQIGLPTDYRIFLYQKDGDLFADDGMRINLDSPVGLAAFEKMCNLFTMYSFPYQYDAANRFRTGEMPILIGDYTGVYNQLKVFATEINGKWEFRPMPGENRPETHELYASDPINNVSISGVNATVMVKGCDQQENSWRFMMWYTGEDCQVGFSNEMVAIMGPSAKQPVANKNALASLPWTTQEHNQVAAQFSELGSVPNYPGAYIIDRYTNFAFLSAYNDKADPSDALLQYINTINKEIERKRNEFNLETLSDGETDYKDLLTKRLYQIEELVGYIRANDQYKAEYDALLTQIEKAVRSDDADELRAAAKATFDLYLKLDPTAKFVCSDSQCKDAKGNRTVVNYDPATDDPWNLGCPECGKEAEFVVGDTFRADRTAVMGYDMENTSLSKADRKQLRKCFSYEVYKNTKNIVSQFKCMSDLLDDAARCFTGN